MYRTYEETKISVKDFVEMYARKRSYTLSKMIRVNVAIAEFKDVVYLFDQRQNEACMQILRRRKYYAVDELQALLDK